MILVASEWRGRMHVSSMRLFDGSDSLEQAIEYVNLCKSQGSIDDFVYYEIFNDKPPKKIKV
jgi:hypothetical protein